jgi:hypothetical protein
MKHPGHTYGGFVPAISERGTTFLSGLNDDIQFQLLNTDYTDFQHMVDKTIVIENKIKEMEMDGKRKVPLSRQSSRSNVRPRFS